MCGLTGLWSPRLTRDDELRAAARRMATAITHRGPDDSGEWAAAESGVALGFRRLSILDLSALGHQPMASRSGRYHIVFNGEVYNFAALRPELERLGASFRGHSDTEIILAAFEQWGVRAAVQRFVGMFAMAVWDAEARTLSLVRDRLGIKPLFYFHEPGYLSFGSELKALEAGPRFTREVDRDALTAYLRYLYVPAPHGVWRGVRKLPPGTVLTVRDPGQPLPAPEPYWELHDVAAAGLDDPYRASDGEVTDALERLLQDAVSLRMVADVPVGALLSGGVDSSVVVALMQAASSRPVRTYTIGFDDPAHDESQHARRVAEHLHTDHTELQVTGRDALEVIPRLAEMYDEPLADPSQIPTFLVCAMARRDVTVALSGDGGDELFCGYNRYVHGRRLLARFARLPSPARRAAASALRGLSAERWNALGEAVAPLLPRRLAVRLPGEKVHKTANLLAGGSLEAMYRSLLSAWQAPGRAVPGGREPPDAVAAAFARRAGGSLLRRMMLADQGAYLPDDLLAKVDRASMAVSLEVRVPVLDHRVVELSWRLPERLMIREARGKWLLRQVLYRHVPASIVERPKVGFTVPLSDWLRGPLRGWAEDLLAAPGAAADLLDMAVVREHWTRVRDGREASSLSAWAVVLFLAWARTWLS
jgi:asparagine synthase (glutamine-hydrolysing)